MSICELISCKEMKESKLCIFLLLLLCPQAALPSVPPDTKLSKLDVLVLATNYIAYLTETLDQGGTLAEHTLPSRPGGYLHPVKVRSNRFLLTDIHRECGLLDTYNLDVKIDGTLCKTYLLYMFISCVKYISCLSIQYISKRIIKSHAG